MVANPKKDRALGPAMVAEASPHSAGGEIPVAERAGWKAYQAEKREFRNGPIRRPCRARGKHPRHGMAGTNRQCNQGFMER